LAGMSAYVSYRSRSNANSTAPGRRGRSGGGGGCRRAPRRSAGNIQQHSDTSHAARTRHGTRHTAYGTRPWRAISAVIPPAPHPPRLPPACTNTKRVPWRGSTTTYPYVLPRGAAAEPWSMSKAVTTRQGRSPYRRVAAHRQAPQPRPETANNRAQVYCFWCASFGRRMLPRRARAHHDHACE
jgi:hypothetical protein